MEGGEEQGGRQGQEEDQKGEEEGWGGQGEGEGEEEGHSLLLLPQSIQDKQHSLPTPGLVGDS